MKTRTMNELRQEKNYGYKPPLTHNQKSAEARASAPNPSEIPPVNQYDNRLGTHTEINVETTKDIIIDKLGKQYYDIIFQAVCDEMDKHEAFQMKAYFTLQGMDEFEDAWYEFYHEHHGEILHAVINNGIDHTN